MFGSRVERGLPISNPTLRLAGGAFGMIGKRMREDVDIQDPKRYARGVPHDVFRYLRRNAAVSWHDEEDGRAGFWAVVRYRDLAAVSSDWRTFSSAWGSTLEEMTPQELAARRSMMDLDPPAHSRIRRLLSRGFTPRVVRAYEKAFRLMTRELLSEVLARGEFDLVEAISKQIPVLWLCEHMGIPRHMSDRLIEWTDRMLVGDSDPEYWEDRSDPDCRFAPFGSPAGLEAFQYAAELAAERRARPGDDMISLVLQAEPGGEPLTDAEFNNFFTVLMIAGQEASRHSISQGVLALMERPDQMRRLRDGSAELMGRAVEEIIRWATPIYHFRRTATRDVEMAGEQIRRGDKVTIWYISANFDEAVFDDPYRFDIERRPNPQVSFGKGGPHFCLGAALGRLQVKVAMEELLPRLSDLRLSGPVERLQSNFIHGIKRMPVRTVAG